MPEATHVEAAEGRLGRAVDLSSELTGPDQSIPVALVEAQVHASLAIAEQLERLNGNLGDLPQEGGEGAEREVSDEELEAVRKAADHLEAEDRLTPVSLESNPGDCIRIVWREIGGKQRRASTFVAIPDHATEDFKAALAAARPRYTAYLYSEAERMVNETTTQQSPPHQSGAEGAVEELAAKVFGRFDATPRTWQRLSGAERKPWISLVEEWVAAIRPFLVRPEGDRPVGHEVPGDPQNVAYNLPEWLEVYADRFEVDPSNPGEDERGRLVIALRAAARVLYPLPQFASPQPENSGACDCHAWSHPDWKGCPVHGKSGPSPENSGGVEEGLVREAMVLGFCEGVMFGGPRSSADVQKEYPKDSAVVYSVLRSAQSNSDLYPALCRLADEKEAADQTATSGPGSESSPLSSSASILPRGSSSPSSSGPSSLPCSGSCGREPTPPHLSDEERERLEGRVQHLEAQAANVEADWPGFADFLRGELIPELRKLASRQPVEGEGERFLELKERLFSDEACRAGAEAVSLGGVSVRRGDIVEVRKEIAAAWNVATGHSDFPLDSSQPQQQPRGDLICSHCGRLDGRPHNADCAFAKEERQQRDDAVPVVRAEPGKERIDFELECGHVVGLARADVVSVNGDDELELPTSLTCPVCQHHVPTKGQEGR